MNPLLQRPNATTVIVPYVSYHAIAKDFLAFSCYLLIGGPAKGLTRGRSQKLNLAGSLYIDGPDDRLVDGVASYDYSVVDQIASKTFPL